MSTSANTMSTNTHSQWWQATKQHHIYTIHKKCLSCYLAETVVHDTVDCISFFPCDCMVLLSQFCLSVRPSVRRVYRDKTKRCTADIFIPHEMAIALVLWHQEWLWAMPPSLRNIRQKWPTPHAKLIVPCNQYFICQDFICIWQVAIRSHYSCPAYSYGVSPCTEPLAVLTTAQWTFWM